jgi:hypothetical protein
MEKKPDYQLVYVYTKKKFKRDMWTYLAIWVVLRALRVILYLSLGTAYLTTITAAFIFFGTGMVWGFAILSVIVYRRSHRPEPGVELLEENPHHKH